MIKALLFLFAAYVGVIGKKASTAAVDKVEVIIILGQSNAAGRAESQRLANDSYNYRGIAAGYPTVRSGQAQYASNPAGVFIYHKPTTSVTEDYLNADNASWLAYDAGANANSDFVAYPLNKAFGCELSLATKISEATGKTVYIIKCAIGGTALVNGNTATPGAWNNIVRRIATESYIRRAIRDLKIAEPTKTFNLAGVVWWQGEQDAGNGVSAATYKSAFYDLKAVIDNCIKETFPLKHSYIWNIVKLRYNLDAGETTINSTLSTIVTEKSDCRLINIDAYPRKTDLATVEAAPVTKNATLNSANGVDNNHTSYIGQLAAGELIFNNIINDL